MSSDDDNKVARLKSNPPLGRGRSDTASGGDSARGQVIQVATRCATIDEFVERFAAFAWESSLVLPAASALPVGTQGRFVILLRDHTVAMRGRCRVTEAKPTPVSSRNPAVKKVMMRVALLEMDEASRVVHRRLCALRSAPVPLPIPPEPSETTQIEPARGGTAPGAAVAEPAAPSRSEGPAPASAAAAPPASPAAAAPMPPGKTPPPAPRVNLSRTIIGVGVGPDGKAVLKHPTPPAVPPLVSNPLANVANTPANPPAPAPAAQNLGTAATLIMTAPPAAPASAPPRALTPPRVETRAPRAAETLPANPLSEFNAEEVESFIECTLIEAEDAPGANAPDGPTTADAPLAAAAAAVRRTTAYVRIRQLAAKLPPGVQSKLIRLGPYVGVFVATLIVGYVLFHRTPAGPPAGVAPAANLAAAPAPAPIAPPAAEPEAKAPAGAIEAPPAAAAAPTKKIAVAEKRAPAEKPAAAEKPAPAAAEKPAPAERSTAPAERPAAADEPSAEPAARPVVAAGTPGVCTARVVTEPKDAKVIWDGKVIGRSPIDGARVPCGTARVTIERERWQPVTVDVTMQSGEAAVVRQKLHRPRGTLAINSSPPGAQISVDRAFVGSAPKRVEAMRYQKVAIKAALKGYQTWNKEVYLREAETKIDIQLSPRK